MLDLQTWLAIFAALATVLGAWYQYLSYQLDKKQQQPTRKAAAMSASSGPRRWLPLLVLILAVSSWVPYIYFRTNVVTPENVEAHTRQWLDAFKLGSTKETTSDAFFTYVVTLTNNKKVLVTRSKAHPGYLTVLGAVTFGDSDRNAIQKMSEADKERLRFQLLMELARAKIGYVLNADRELVLERRVPITAELSESTLIDRINDVDFAITQAIVIIRQNINR